jgi:plastocyanin
VVGVAAALLALVAGAVGYRSGPAVAREEPGLAGMGYPELRVVRSADGYETPTEASPGLVLLTVEAAGEEAADVIIARLPEGVTIEQAQEMIRASADEEFPDFAYEWAFAGGTIAAPGETSQVLLDLEAGEWAILLSVDEPGAEEVRPLSVEVGTGTTMEPPDADAEIELQEYAFVGLPEGAAAGRQIWQVTNTGEQPHILVLLSSPEAITMEQIMTLLSLDEGSPPPDDLGFDPSTIVEGGFVHVISPGQTVWVELDLAAGTNIALCFIPDRETDMPHALMGMIGIFTVGEGGAAEPASTGEGSAVTIANFAFDPAEITVAAGTTVTWTNEDVAPHTVTADDGPFDSGRLDQGGSFSQTFDQPGSFAYHCEFHPSMHGTVVVT